MTPEETKRFNELCLQIISEKDEQKFEKLVRELNKLMAEKDLRLHTASEPKSAT